MSSKKKSIIIVVTLSIISIIIATTFAIMYFKTDMFKSNEILFSKYFAQNFEMIDLLNIKANPEVKSMLETNPYTSSLKANIKYTENKETSDENTENIINKIGVKVTNNVDKSNEYSYRDILIGNLEEDEENLFRIETLTDNKIYAVRLNGIKQFVSTENVEENEENKSFQVKEIEDIVSKIDTIDLIDFSEEEKKELLNTYLNIIQMNVTKDRYDKQRNTLITVNNQDVQTNAYSITLTFEEYNNMYIKVLEQIQQDEIILSKIDKIVNYLEEISSEESNIKGKELKELFIGYIQEKIEEIQNNNIGNDEVKITVYESKGKTVRTNIERTANKITLDLYNESAIKINQILLEENTEEKTLKIEKNSSDIIMEYTSVQNNEIINTISFNYKESLTNNHLEKTTDIKIGNQKYDSILTINNNIDFLEQLQKKMSLGENNIELDNLNKSQKQKIIAILNQNLEEQLKHLSEEITLEDYTKMFKNLGIIKQNTINLPGNVEVTDIERKRFNSKFEFFASTDLKKEHIETLMQEVSNNFDDMKILLKDGTIEDLEIDKLNDSNSEDAKKYKANIKEILISIKEKSTNKEKEEDLLEYLNFNDRDTYTVSLEYDDNKLVRIIRIKIESDE
ncbi:MAG: hypothetical protein HFJ59_03480 [Clostridia bacterium]|nr:hypothetical protein [Clostridia bacterium]